MERLRSMDRVGSNGNDLDLNDIDLESGGTTSEDDLIKGHDLSCENSKKLMGRIRSGFIGPESLYRSTNGVHISNSYDNLFNSDEFFCNNKEQFGMFREGMINFVDEKEKSKKQKSVKPSKLPRPPRGPSSSTCDIKLVKEIYEVEMSKEKKNEDVEENKEEGITIV